MTWAIFFPARIKINYGQRDYSRWNRQQIADNLRHADPFARYLLIILSVRVLSATPVYSGGRVTVESPRPIEIYNLVDVNVSR